MEIATIVTIALNALFALCIILGFLWGLKRGLKSSAMRIGFIAGCLILAFFIAMPVTSSITNMDISSIYTYTDPNGIVHKTPSDIIANAVANISPDVKEAYDNSESLRALIDALPQMIIQSIVFVILFWLLKLITWPIFAIIAKTLWGEKKQKKSKEQQPKTVQSGRVIENGNTRPTHKKKVKKYRWAGATIGTLQGLLIAFFTLLPVAGFSSIVKNIDKQASVSAETTNTNNDNDLKPLGQMLRENLGDDPVNALIAYDKTALGVICGWTGIDGVAFDIQTSAKINGKTTNLRKEVNALSNAYNEASKIKSFDLSKMDFDTVQKLFDYLISSPSLSSIADELMPYYINKTIKESNDIDPTLKELLTMYVDAYGTPKIDELKNDIAHICTALKIIQSNDIFAYVENANPFDFYEFVKIIEANDEKNPLRDIFAEVTQSTTTQKIFQTFINYGLKSLGDEVSKATKKEITVNTVTFDNVNWDNVRDEVPSILNKSISVYRNYKESTETSETNKILSINFKSVGEILQLFSSSSLLEGAFDSAMDILDQYDDYSKYIDFSAMKNKVNFVTEMTYVQNSIDALRSVGALEYFNEGSTMKIEDLLKKIDTIIPDTTDHCIDVVVTNITSSTVLKTSLPKTLNTIYPDLLKDWSSTIDKINNANIDWKNETATLKKIAHFACDNIDIFTKNFTAKKLLNEINVAELGENIDAMRDSKLFFPVVKAGIDYAKSNADFKEYLNVDALSTNLNFTSEFKALSNAINVAKNSGIMDKILTGGNNMTQDILDILNSDQTIASNLVDNLFDSSIIHKSVEPVVNKLQSLVGDAINIKIEKATIDVNDFVQNLATKKVEFSNILNSIAKVGSTALASTFSLDTFADKIDDFANAFTALQNSSEFHNTYVALVDYLSTSEKINDVIDFTVVGNNFDYTAEFGKLKEIINILKTNNIWQPLVDGTGKIEDLVDTLDADTKEQITQKILESKLFVGYATKALNNMIDEFNTCLGASVAHIPDGTDLSSQSENIAKITKYLSNIDTNNAINIDNIDLNNLGNLLTELKINKFNFTPSGALSGVYDAFVDYMLNDGTYGYIILDACNFSTGLEIAPKDNETILWPQVTSAFDELLNVYDSLTTIETLTANNVVSIFETIGTSKNTLVPRLVKTYLKHGETDSNKIDAINNFDFSDTLFNSSAIRTLYSLKDCADAIDANDKDTSLANISEQLNTLSVYDRTKLDNLIAFIDAVTNKDIASYTNGVDFAIEKTCVDNLRTLLNVDKYSLETLKSAIDAIKDSTLVLGKLAEQNIVICDVDSDEVLNDIVGSSASQETKDAIVKEIKDYIKNNVSDATKQNNIAKILGLTL